MQSGMWDSAPSKTKFMIIRPYSSNDISLKIDNDPIEQVSSYKYLGIYIDNRLNYKTHVSQLGNKLSSLQGVSFKLGRMFDLISARSFYFSFAEEFQGRAVIVPLDVLIISIHMLGGRSIMML